MKGLINLIGEYGWGEAVQLIVAIVSGGGLVALFNYVMNRSEVRIGGEAELRDQLLEQSRNLREHITHLNEQIRTYQAEIKDWSDRYYLELGEKLALKSKVSYLESRMAEQLKRNTELMQELSATTAKLLEVEQQLRAFEGQSNLTY